VRIAPALAVIGLVALFGAPAHAFEIKQVTSPGGITAWLVEDHTLPIVSMQLGFIGGSANDPPDKPGLANFTFDLLDEGAGALDATAFKGRLEDLAASYDLSVDNDLLNVSLRTLSANFGPALDLVHSSLTEPTFSDQAVARVRGQLVASLERAAHEPHSIANRLWWNQEMPGHPYGAPGRGTPGSVARITSDDLRGFVHGRLAKDVLLIGVVGDITAQELAPLLDKTFGALPAHAAPSAVIEAAPRVTPELLLATLPIPQSVVVFGQPGIKRADPDWYAAYLVMHVLGGGGLTSRLSLEVREKRGLAYNVYAGLEPLLHGGVIQGGVATENARVGESIDLIRAEWRRMRDQGPNAAELAAAKTYLTGSFPLGLDSTLRVAELLVIMQRDHLGLDYLSRRNALINGVSVADARRVARKLLDPDALIFTVVGAPENLKGARAVEPTGG